MSASPRSCAGPSRWCGGWRRPSPQPGSRSRSTPRSGPWPRRRSTPGATIVNDVTALRADPDIAASAPTAAPGSSSCTCRATRGRCSTTRVYDDVVDDVRAFLAERVGGGDRRRGCRGEDLARPGDRLRQDARAQPRAAARGWGSSPRSACRSSSAPRARASSARSTAPRSASGWAGRSPPRCWRRQRRRGPPRPRRRRDRRRRCGSRVRSVGERSSLVGVSRPLA